MPKHPEGGPRFVRPMATCGPPPLSGESDYTPPGSGSTIKKGDTDTLTDTLISPLYSSEMNNSQSIEQAKLFMYL